jgi:hypothetical protein
MPDGENWLFAMFKVIPCLCVFTLFLATIISLTHEDTNLALFFFESHQGGEDLHLNIYSLISASRQPRVANYII